jgi:hypothetical protein
MRHAPAAPTRARLCCQVPRTQPPVHPTHNHTCAAVLLPPPEPSPALALPTAVALAAAAPAAGDGAAMLAARAPAAAVGLLGCPVNCWLRASVAAVAVVVAVALSVAVTIAAVTVLVRPAHGSVAAAAGTTARIRRRGKPWPAAEGGKRGTHKHTNTALPDRPRRRRPHQGHGAGAQAPHLLPVCAWRRRPRPRQRVLVWAARWSAPWGSSPAATGEQAGSTGVVRVPVRPTADSSQLAAVAAAAHTHSQHQAAGIQQPICRLP